MNRLVKINKIHHFPLVSQYLSSLPVEGDGDMLAPYTLPLTLKTSSAYYPSPFSRSQVEHFW